MADDMLATEDDLRPTRVPESQWADDEEYAIGGSWKSDGSDGWNDSCGDDEDDSPVPLTKHAPQAGQAAKWRPDEFSAFTHSLAPAFSQELSQGLADGDDCMVVHINNDQAVAFCLDWSTPMVDDYYQFGAIAAASALSPLYAVGAKPMTALNMMALPCKMGVDMVGQIVRGGSDKVVEAGAFVVGGHSIDDDTPKYGLATFGVALPESVIRNECVVPGDVLFATKPQGTGILVQAYCDDALGEQAMAQAVASMLQLDKAAVEAWAGLGVHGAVAVGSLGLAGHLHAMLDACGAAACLQWDAVELFEGVWSLAQGGTVTQRGIQTAAWASGFVSCTDGQAAGARLAILCDPQTSGGLLMAIDPADADAFAYAFRATTGHPPACIGHVTAGEPGTILIN